MALVYSPSEAVVIHVTFTDEAANQTTKSYVVNPLSWEPGTGLWAALVAIRDALLVDLNASTDALITGVHTTVKQVEDTSPAIGAAGSEVENLASIVLNLDTAGKFAVMQIPAPNIGLFQGPSGPEKNQIDTADAALTALVANFQATGGDFTISDGELVDDADPIKSGKRIHRRSNKG